jgi:hypothetical protein
MSQRAFTLATVCWLLLAANGCSEDPLTQIVVVVDSDWDGFERIRIDIDGFGDGTPVNASAADGELLLPKRVALVHEGGPLGPFSLTVRGYAAGMHDPVLVEPRSDLAFERGKTRMLKIDLLFECIGMCSAGEACLAGPTCVDSGDRRATRLTPWDGEPGDLDLVYRVGNGDVVSRRDGGDGSMPVFGDGSPLPDAAGGRSGSSGGGRGGSGGRSGSGGSEPEGGVEAGAAGDDGGADAEIDAGPVMPAPAFDYVPANFDPTSPEIADIDRHAIVLDCGTSTFDSTDRSFSDWCGPEPSALLITQSDDTEAVVLVMDTLSVAAGSTLRLVGTRPVILAVFGDARVGGRIDASAEGAMPGPGADRGCEPGAGATGANGGTYNAAGGGSGGGFGSPGASGGRGAATIGTAPAAVSGGVANGSATLSPLRGGCSGGSGGRGDGATGTPGGGGGGALQISAAGRLEVYGAIRAAGGGGGVSADSEDGGGGGGSGGAILLEAQPLDLDGTAVISANGGGGGSGQASFSSNNAEAGADGAADITVAAGGSASGNGGDGGSGAARAGDAAGGSDGTTAFGNGGGGGGGGGVGRIRVNNVGVCVVRGVFSPFARVGDCPGYPALGCNALERSGRLYYFCPELDWTSARAQCEAAQLTLARIETQAENDFVSTAIAGDSWLGAADSSEGNWVWTDGTPFWIGDQTGSAVAARYNAWAAGEPNNSVTGSNSNADCAAIASDGSWSDRDCDVAHRYVCEP